MHTDDVVENTKQYARRVLRLVHWLLPSLWSKHTATNDGSNNAANTIYSDSTHPCIVQAVQKQETRVHVSRKKRGIRKTTPAIPTRTCNTPRTDTSRTALSRNTFEPVQIPQIWLTCPRRAV